jgi:hypothetical protein
LKIETFKCDGCGIMKGENNHWFEFVPADPKVTRYCITIIPFPKDPVNDSRHLCSDQCVIKAVQQWLSEQKESR